MEEGGDFLRCKSNNRRYQLAKIFILTEYGLLRCIRFNKLEKYSRLIIDSTLAKEQSECHGARVGDKAVAMAIGEVILQQDIQIRWLRPNSVIVPFRVRSWSKFFCHLLDCKFFGVDGIDHFLIYVYMRNREWHSFEEIWQGWFRGLAWPRTHIVLHIWPLIWCLKFWVRICEVVFVACDAKLHYLLIPHFC